MILHWISVKDNSPHKGWRGEEIALVLEISTVKHGKKPAMQ
jgi:hypothetical protein